MCCPDASMTADNIVTLKAGDRGYAASRDDCQNMWKPPAGDQPANARPTDAKPSHPSAPLA
jgi:hypothetical protein